MMQVCRFPGCLLIVSFQGVRLHVKGKGKVFPVHAMKAYRGSTGIAPPIRNPYVRDWLTSRSLSARESTPEQKGSGHFGD